MVRPRLWLDARRRLLLSRFVGSSYVLALSEPQWVIAPRQIRHSERNHSF